MAVVITLNSDSDSESDVEIVGFYSNKNVMLPLSSVRVSVDALDVKTSPSNMGPSLETPQGNSCQEQVTGFPRKSPVAHQFSQPTLTQNTELSSILCASASSKGQTGLSYELRAHSPSLPVGTLTLQPTFSGCRNRAPACPSTFHSDDVKAPPEKNPKYENLNRTMTELLEPICDDPTFDKMSVSHSPCPESAPSAPRTIYSDYESLTQEEDFGTNSPVSFSWEDNNVDAMADFDLGLDFDCTSPTEDDKFYVCPAAFKRLLHSGGDALMDGKNYPQMLCQRSLSMVYSTMQENYPEGTLQFLSDLLQPGYYPPKEITLHLLKDILLNPQSPYYNSEQAFRLLMKTQRHHSVDKESVSWNWEMLSSVMEQKELQPENVRMFLEYVVQTLEDDFKTKRSTSALNQSIAKAVLSIDQQLPNIRDVCKWLFSAIEKSTNTEDVEGNHTRMVVIFQKMLSLALEVDCSPAISSGKLSQELFHMLLSNVPLRPQRLLLLESLQSKRLRCKLLQHLLDYSCPVKTAVPLSLSLLLHFLKNCTLTLDPTDQTEKWQKWEELIHHLWMLLLSYSSTMKGYLCGTKMEQRNKVGTWIYKPEDMVSKQAVREAVEAFLSRSQEDIGEALPLHVEESLSYLQDHLMDVSVKCFK